MVVRDFKAAANFFLDTISTFTSYELMDYASFVRYTVYVGMIALPRNELRDKVVKGSEILEVLHGLPEVGAPHSLSPTYQRSWNNIQPRVVI